MPDEQPSPHQAALRASLLRPSARTVVTVTGSGVVIDERALTFGLLDGGTREHVVPLDEIREVRVRLAESVPQLLVGLVLIGLAAPLFGVAGALGALSGVLGAALALTSAVARLRLGTTAGARLVEVPATELGRLRALGALVRRRCGLEDPDDDEE